MINIERKIFVNKLGFEPQISGFTHRRLNQLVHPDTYTNSETNLSLPLSLSLTQIFLSIFIIYMNIDNKIFNSKHCIEVVAPFSLSVKNLYSYIG